MRVLTLFICLLLAMESNAQQYSCKVYYFGPPDTATKHLCEIRHFNKYGKLLSEECYENHFNCGSFTVDTCAATTHYFYQDDTLIIRSVNNVPGNNECTITSYTYDNNKLLVSDTERHSYNRHRFISDEPDSIQTSETVNVYAYNENKQLIEQTHYDNAKKTYTERTTYQTDGRITTKEIWGIKWFEKTWKQLALSYYTYDPAGKLIGIVTWGHKRFSSGLQTTELALLSQHIYSYNKDIETDEYHWPEEDGMVKKSITQKYTCKSDNTLTITENKALHFTNNRWSDQQTSISEYGFFPDKRIVREFQIGPSSFLFEYY